MNLPPECRARRHQRRIWCALIGLSVPLVVITLALCGYELYVDLVPKSRCYRLLDDAALAFEARDYARAVTLYEAVLPDLWRCPDEQALRIHTLQSLADSAALSGQVSKAIVAREELLPLIEAECGAGSEEVRGCLQCLRGLYGHIGQTEDAVEYARKAVAIAEKGPGTRHKVLISDLIRLAAYEIPLGHLEAAQQHLGRARDLIVKYQGEDAGQMADCMATLHDLYQAQGLFPEAQAARNRADEIAIKHRGETIFKSPQTPWEIHIQGGPD